LIEDAYKDKTMSINQINHVIIAVREGKNTSDRCHSNHKRISRTDDVIAAVAASVEKDRRLTISGLAFSHVLTGLVIQQILTVDLGLLKKGSQTAVLCPEREAILPQRRVFEGHSAAFKSIFSNCSDG
jgi:hypothetical protein